TVDAAAEKPELAAVQVLGDMEIYVDGVLDVETELARLDSQRENLLKRIEGAQKKLSNENFVSRAPADIVAKERERLAELENQLALVDENIAQLRA
ncbi:MAG: valine--tRNA ligase, partial [Calditrichaeota bacterium]|nr:valine--tRNA ligase [Calditrichota bacterium]